MHLMPYAGVLVYDDGELEAQGIEVDIGPVVGARVGFALARSWQIEAAYGFAPMSTEPSDFSDDDVDLGDLNAHIFYGAINYLLGYEGNPTRLLLAAGAGGVIMDPEPGSRTGSFLIDFGVGFTHPVRDWITFRGEVRDHVTFCSAPETGCPTDDDVLHHLEISAGLQFWLN